MFIIEAIQGNIQDADWQSRLAGVQIDYLTMDQWEAQKNRFRKVSDGGVELAVSLDRGKSLRDGDILLWDEAKRSAVVAHIHLKDVLVIEMQELLAQAPDVLLRTAVELGHAIGNQHWPAVVKGTQVFVPLAVDKKVMSSVMKTHAFEGITYSFMPGSEVIPYLAPHESRRLFGGAEGPVHSHTQAYEQEGNHAHH
ncbi:MAG: urease accessory protein UreE [Caldilineaceae bacterium]|nr:urease accessory protein UreE [Caldilineaceae bacterium]